MTDTSETARRPRFTLTRIVPAFGGLILAAVALFLTLNPDLSGSGTVVAREAYVHGPVSQVGVARDARIASLEVQIGDAVSSGDIVARLDDAALDAEKRRIDAEIARLEAELTRLIARQSVEEKRDMTRIAEARADKSAAEARLAEARIDLEGAERDADRVRSLAASGTASEVRLETARQARDEFVATVQRRMSELDAAEARLETTRDISRDDDVLAAERAIIASRIEKARAEAARIETEIARTRVDTRVDGIVVSVQSRAGASVVPGDTIVSVWNTDRIWMQAWIEEADVDRVSVGDPARIRIDALGGEVFDGRIERILVAEDGREQTRPGEPISPLLSEETRFALQVAFTQAEGLEDILLPGMSGIVEIDAGEGEPIVPVLASALR